MSLDCDLHCLPTFARVEGGSEFTCIYLARFAYPSFVLSSGVSVRQTFKKIGHIDPALHHGKLEGWHMERGALLASNGTNADNSPAH